MVQLAKRWGVKPETLLGPFGLEEKQLEQPSARLSADTQIALTARARDLTEPGFGIYLGLQKQASSYGFLGFAAMSASTMREALESTIEFTAAVTTSLSLSLRVEGPRAALVLHEKLDLGPVRDVALFSLFIGMRQITHDLTGRKGYADIELDIAEPDYFARFAHILPGTRFGQPVCQLVFNASGLDVPLMRPDRAAFNLAREQCQKQLDALGFDGSLPSRVRRALVTDDGFRSLEQVAEALHVSVRTLKRKLSQHDTSYSSLRQEERLLRAMHLLRATDLTLDHIATKLGYATTSNFSRAFAQWTGQSPAAYRSALPTQRVIDTTASPR